MAYTEEQLKKKRLPDLKAIAEELDIDQSGLAKGGIIEAIIDTQKALDAAAASADAEDELDDDEVDDTSGVPADMTDEADDEELDDEELDEEELDEVDDAPKAKAAAKPKKEPKPKSAKALAAEAAGEETLAAKQVATALGTEAKTLRQFLRSDASTFEAVGSGGRYEFTANDVIGIRKEFEAWKAAHASRGGKRGPNKSTEAAAAAPAIEEIEEIEELEDDELDDTEVADEDLELDDEEDD